ncbi:MAG TPA: SDR family NAD(P)-dependent oxidoreductase, partial [Actinomycetaceae bacterium]|nr:SDR family NAD(P)-dependent oxidoreductase [Actinomycetaceae bacterium]
MNLKNSGSLVVGGASGLGEATARLLHAEGSRVVIADRDSDRGSALAADLGERAQFVATDVTDEASVAAAVATAAEAAPEGLRISVMCAGIPVVQKTVSRGEPAELAPFRASIDVNLVGTFNVLRLAAARMATNEPDEDGERGVCVNTSSIAAFEGQIGQIAYSAA